MEEKIESRMRFFNWRIAVVAIAFTWIMKFIGIILIYFFDSFLIFVLVPGLYFSQNQNFPIFQVYILALLTQFVYYYILIYAILLLYNKIKAK